MIFIISLDSLNSWPGSGYKRSPVGKCNRQGDSHISILGEIRNIMKLVASPVVFSQGRAFGLALIIFRRKICCAVVSFRFLLLWSWGSIPGNSHVLGGRSATGIIMWKRHTLFAYIKQAYAQTVVTEDLIKSHSHPRCSNSMTTATVVRESMFPKCMIP